MPDTFTFEEAVAAPAAKSFTFEEARGFSFEEAAPQRARREALQAEMGAARRARDRWETVGNVLGFAEQQAGRIAGNPIGSMIGPVVDVPLDAAFNRPPGEGQRLEKAFAAPTINLPRAGEAKTLPGQVAAGVYNAGAELVAAFSAPGMVAILPAGVSKPVLTAWISGMAAHAPERLLRARELAAAGKMQDAITEVAGTVAELGLAEVGRRHVMKGDALSAADVEGPPRLNINERGEVAERASPDLVARNIASPGTVRPTEQRALASPIEGREKPAEVIFERVPVFNGAGEVVEVQRVPRIREIQFEEPGIIIPEPRLLKPDVEGGKLPERRQGFERTAEDFIEETGARRRESEVRSQEPGGRSQGEASTVPLEVLPPEEPLRQTPFDTSKLTPEERKRHESWAEEFFHGDDAIKIETRPEAIDVPAMEAAIAKRLFESGEVASAIFTRESLSRVLGIDQWTRIAPLVDVGLLRRTPEGYEFNDNIQRAGTLKRAGQKRPAATIGPPTAPEVAITESAPAGSKSVEAAPEPAGMSAREQSARRNYEIDRDIGNSIYNRNIPSFDESIDRMVKAGDSYESAKEWLVALNNFEETPRMGKAVEYAKSNTGKGLPPELPTASKAAAPKPGLVSGTSVEAWADRMIAEGRKRVNTGVDPELFAAYVVKGAAHIERGARRFSEWAPRMIAEYGDAVRPHLQRIFAEAQSGLAKVRVDDGGVRQRKLAARGSVSPQVPEAHRQRLKTGREAFYEPQNIGRVEESVAQMSNVELASVPVVRADGPNNLWTAAQLELYRRNVAAGNLDAAWGVMEQAMKTGTTLGQLVNQFKLLRGATPDGVLAAINRRLVGKGFDPMRPGEQLRVRKLAEESIRENARWKEAERQYQNEPTPENLERVIQAREDAVIADVELQRKVQQYEPRVFFDLVTTLLKGNLLSPISQVANIVGNASNLAIRGVARDSGAIVDAVDAYLRNRPRTMAMVGLRGARESLKAIGRTVDPAARELWRGADDASLSKADVRGGLKPLVALRDLFRAQIEGPKRDGKTPFSQRLLMALEASPFAMHATAQLRLLGAVDKPFREAARARLITEALKVQDLNRPKGTPSNYTRQNVARAVRYPELFLDAETLARIDNEAAYAVYQNRNPMGNAIARAMQGAPPGVRFLVATVAPYVTTPINVIAEWMSYNPALAAGKAILAAKRGETRKLQQASGKFVAGSMMLAAGYWLYQKGIISPSLDREDEQQKARVLAGMTMPPRHINLTGLERALQGGDPRWRTGDKTMDILRAGGVAGALMLSTTDVMRQREREPEAGGLDFAGRVWGDQWTQVLQYGVNQSFLKGIANLLEAVQDGKLDSWAAQYVDTLTAIPLPGTLNALARATRDFKPEVRGDALDQRLENQLRSRLGVFGADDNLPYKRDLWGRPVPETPAGANPWLHHLLDVSKGTRVPQDDTALLIYGLWRKTGRAEVIPTPPDASLVIAGRKYELDREQLSRLQELTGVVRKDIADRLLLNPYFINAPAEAKIQVLARAWKAGGRRGQVLFWRERGTSLQPKGQPAGFDSAP